MSSTEQVFFFFGTLGCICVGIYGGTKLARYCSDSESQVIFKSAAPELRASLRDPEIELCTVSVQPEDPGISSVVELDLFYVLLLAVGFFFLVITAVKTLLCTNYFVRIH